MDETWITPQQLADRWGLSPKSLANQRCMGTGLPFLKVGQLVRYALSDVVAYERDQIVRPL